ncbi:ANK1 [Symbiodinium sp. CCMP2592]|nr:ANK1 [Symbiodinium sp. CCMP2592]
MTVTVALFLALCLVEVSSLRDPKPREAEPAAAWAEGESFSSMAVEAETEAFLINAQGSDGVGALRLDSEFPQYDSAAQEEMSFLDGSPGLDGTLDPCQRDLRSLVNALESTCKIHEPKRFARRPRDSEYHPECFQDLQNMTCAESARDILLYGKELVKAMQVPANLVWNYYLPEGKKFRKENWKTYRLVQKLFFLKSWLRKVAAPAKHAILWSGFWTDPEVGPTGRTSKESLFAFASLTEHDTLHPSTELGRIMEAHQELSACFHVESPIALNMANNVWALASFMFVLGSEKQEQSTVVALVNKQLEGERPLKHSVLFKHEMPTLGIAAYGLGHWSPHVLVIDMLGTCHMTGPALRHQLLAGGIAWYPVLEEFQFFSARDFAQRSTMSWTCWDCPESSCRLDVALAQAVQRASEAKDEADRNCKEVFQAAAKGLHVTWTAELTTQCRDPSTGKRPQHVEAERGLVSVLRLLLDNRADPNVKDSDGNTPLHYAALEGRSEVIRLLLANRAEPNVKNIHETMPLHLAARRGVEDAVRLLLQKKADLNVQDSVGMTPLNMAAHWAPTTVVRLLLDKKADPNIKPSPGPGLALHGAANAGNAEVVRLLLDKKAEPNAKDFHETTPLHVAAAKGHSEVVRLLLEKKAELNVKDTYGSTPLQYARQKSHLEVVHLLEAT